MCRLQNSVLSKSQCITLLHCFKLLSKTIALDILPENTYKYVSGHYITGKLCNYELYLKMLTINYNVDNRFVIKIMVPIVFAYKKAHFVNFTNLLVSIFRPQWVKIVIKLIIALSFLSSLPILAKRYQLIDVCFLKILRAITLLELIFTSTTFKWK